MNNGIKKKLEELIGEKVGVIRNNYGVSIDYHPASTSPYEPKIILRFENEDCFVLGDKTMEQYISIDHITEILIYNK